MTQFPTAIFECSYFNDEDEEIDITFKIPDVNKTPSGLVGFTLDILENILQENNLSKDAQRQILDTFYANNNCDDDEYFWIEPNKIVYSSDENTNIECEYIPMSNKTSFLSEVNQELFDKLNGNPCTDLYEFKFISHQECKEMNLPFGYAWKNIKRENPTEDQKNKRVRPEYLYEKEIENDFNINNINISNSLIEQIQKEYKKAIDKEILNHIKGIK